MVDYKLGDRIIFITDEPSPVRTSQFNKGNIYKIVQMDKNNNDCVLEGVNNTIDFITEVPCPDGIRKHRIGWTVRGFNKFVRLLDDPCGECISTCRSDKKCPFYQEK